MRRIFISILAICWGAGALAQIPLTGAGPGALGRNYFLPTTNAGFIYSLSRAVSTYAGSAFRAQRADTTQQDIGFVGNNLDVASALSFNGGGCLISMAKWYDQSGNTIDASQAGATLMPVVNLCIQRPAVCFSNRVLSAANNAAFGLSGDQSLVAVGSSYGGAGGIGVFAWNDTSGSRGWGWGVDQTNYNLSYWAGGSAVWTNDASHTDYSGPSVFGLQRTSGTAKFYVNGTNTLTQAGRTNSASTSALFIGGSSAIPASPFNGCLNEVAAYSSSALDMAANAVGETAYWGSPAVLTTAFAGASAINSANNNGVSSGSVLQFERTQPWTAFSAVKLINAPQTAAIVFTNADTVLKGYELYIDTSCFMHSRLINTTTTNALGVVGSKNLCDGQWHYIAETYDGSSTPAGIQFYVDCVADAGQTTEWNTLSASILNAGNLFYTTNQHAHLGFYFTGIMDEFQLHNTNRNSTYMTTHCGAASLPPDSDSVLSYHYDEGTGTSTTDSSPSGFTGTLGNAGMWPATSP